MERRIQSLDEFINESKVGRGWSGKIENIDKLLSWMYDKNIMNKTEQDEKDRTFRQYYRYYNDGDKPQGMSYERDEVVESYIEKRIEGFIKKILAKYMPKINRKEFYFDELLSDLYTLKSVVEDHDAHGLLNYWSKKVKVGEPKFDLILDELSNAYDLWKKELNMLIDKNISNVPSWEKSYNVPRNYTVEATKSKLEEVNLWKGSKVEQQYEEIVGAMDAMAEIIDNVIKATQDAKKLIEK